MSNMETNATKAKNDKKKVKKNKKVANHDESKMYGIYVHSPHVMKAEYFAPTKERLLKTISRLKSKALKLREFHNFKFDIINPSKK